VAGCSRPTQVSVCASRTRSTAFCLCLREGAATGRNHPPRALRPGADRQAWARGEVRVTLPDAEVGSVLDASIALLAADARVRSDQIVLMGEMLANIAAPALFVFGGRRPRDFARRRVARLRWSVLLEFLDGVVCGRWPGADRVGWEFESDTSHAYDFANNRRFE
jgi:hypothetical protein